MGIDKMETLIISVRKIKKLLEQSVEFSKEDETLPVINCDGIW